ncbi:MAG TPA: hypothetical protein VJL89_09590, partial [Thermodesulfovibrionia bacterium]|nr:hypothetical protein [Thermodesulfovibrionia bacterium]
MSNKNLAQKWESLKYLIAAIGVNIIFYALIYFFGLISIKAKLNMLGIWTEISYSQEIFQEIFIDFIKITTEQLVLISTLFIPIVGLAIVVLFILLKRFKYSLDWNRYKPFPLISCIVLTIIYFFIF